jgi:DNA-binding HxlR family transcriptional regulator
MMNDEVDDAAKNKRIDELSMKAFELDDICKEIWLTLLAKERLRFSELHRSLEKLGTDISKPSLLEHLDHLIKQKLITRKVEGFQNVSYGLTEEIYSLIHVSQEDIEEWLEVLENDEGLPAKLRSIEFDMNAYYRKMTEKQLDQETDRDLDDTLALGLFELKNLISYDLKIDKKESDADFWKFIGNPLYRTHERTIVEKCRESDRYKEKLFDKMQTMINELRSHKTLRQP